MVNLNKFILKILTIFSIIAEPNERDTSCLDCFGIGPSIVQRDHVNQKWVSQKWVILVSFQLDPPRRLISQ